MREFANAATEKLDFRYALAQAVLKPGRSTLPHRMKTSEVYYILEGNARMHIEGEVADVGPECMIDIPPMAAQWIENTGEADLKFLCIVDPAWRPEDEIIL